MKETANKQNHTGVISAATACLAVLVCCVAFFFAFCTGVARLYNERTAINGDVAASEKALQNSSHDPFVYETRGLILSEEGNYTEAVKNFETATKLRPKDYYLWLELAQARDDAGNVQAAMKDYERAVELAPYYSKPRWLFGNYLLRLGNIERAFKEMRLAVTSDSSLFPTFLDMAWSIAQEDIEKVINLTQLQNDAEKLQLAKFLVSKNQTEAALKIYRSTNTQTSENERKILVKELWSQKEYEAAYEVQFGKPFNDSNLSNGSFEQAFDGDEEGFNWYAVRWIPTLSFSFDTNNPNEGTRSLLVEFKGELSSEKIVLKQIVPVRPNSVYQLSFAARSQKLLSAGLPFIQISDTDDEKKVFAASTELQNDVSDWKIQTVSFTTDSKTHAVVIGLRRQKCSVQPCPIVGRLWLDNFSLKHN